MSEYKYPIIHRISCEISDEIYDKLLEIFDHGEKTKVVTVLLEKFIELHDKHGPAVKYAIMAGKGDILKMSEEHDFGDKE